jgi:CHASE2 domain-containing sensor protein
VFVAEALGRSAAVRAFEARSVDARMALRGSRVPDPRLLMLSIDEASLARDAMPLADRADEIAGTLERVFAAGASAIAIDLLLPPSWSASPSFTRLILGHRDRLVLAAFAAPAGTTVGPECLAGPTRMALGPQWFDLFGFVNLDADSDGVVRTARLTYRDREGRARDAFATRAARAVGARPSGPAAFWVDGAVDPDRVPRLSWKDVGERLDRDPGFFEGRLAFVGAELEGSGDDHLVPRHRAPIPGVQVQALVADALLATRGVRAADRRVIQLAVGATATGLAALVLLRRRLRPAWILSAVVLAAWVAASVILLTSADLVSPLVTPTLAAALALAAALLLRSFLPAGPPLPEDALHDRHVDTARGRAPAGIDRH